MSASQSSFPPPGMPTGLDPGIRRVVTFLRKHGFHTTDSGDGTKVGMSCAVDYPHVFMTVSPSAFLIEEADRLARLLRMHFAQRSPPPDMVIQANYDPSNRVAVLALTGLDDAGLPA